MSLFEELKRRNVVKVAVLYVVASWLLLQVADVLFPNLGAPDWAFGFVLGLLILFFFPAVIFSWVYEMTPEGLKREKEIDRSQSITASTGHKINVLIVVLLVLAIAVVAVDRLVPENETTAEITGEEPANEAPADVVAVDPVALAAAKFAPAPDRSIAVLPFVNMSSDPEQEYFSDGLSEELLNLLAQVPELHVASRTSAFSFKGKDVKIADVAAELKVAHILEGSVRKAGKQVRITAQLIDADRDVHLWSETWDRTLDDVFAIQDEIAASVVRELRVTLLGASPTVEETDPQAYALYLQARHLGRQGSAESMLTAIELYKEVLAIDPDYAPAWNGMSSSYTNLASIRVIPEDEGYAMAIDAAERALVADPNSAQAYAGLGWHANVRDGDYAASAEYYRKALELAPNDDRVLNGAAVLLNTLGRLDESIRILRLLSERDPVNATVFNNLASVYSDTGRLDDANATIDKALALSPDFVTARFIKALLEYRRGDYQAYLDGMDWVAEATGVGGWRLMGRVFSYSKMGRQAEAEQGLADLKQEYAEDFAYGIAVFYAQNQQPDAALEWLEKAYEFDGPGGLSDARSDWALQPLHDDPRWQALLSKAGLSDAQVAAIDFQVDLPE